MMLPAWLALIWQAEAARRPLWLAVAFGSGTALYLVLPQEPSHWLPVAIAGPSLVYLLSGGMGIAQPIRLDRSHACAGVWCWSCPRGTGGRRKT